MRVAPGSTDVSVYYYIVQDASATSPGEPVTGLLFSDIETGGSASYARQGAARVDLTLITLASASAAHSDGGFILVDDTNMPGLYRCDYPDAAFVSGVDQVFCQIVVASGNDAIAAPILVDIGTPIANVVEWLSTAVAPPTVAGVPEVDTTHLVGGLVPTPNTTGVPDVNVFEWKDAEPAGLVDTDKIEASIQHQGVGVELLDSGGSVGTSADELVDDVWDEVLTGATHNVAQSSGRRLRALSGTIFTEGTAQSGGNNSIQLAIGDVSLDNDFRRSRVIITGGTGAGQEAIITSSVASTDTLTITPTWNTNPDVTSEYEVIPGQVNATVTNGGYDNGFIYVDTVNGTAGTEMGVNGTSTNPSDNLTDAFVIANAENIRKFFILSGSVVTLPSNSSGFEFNGATYTVTLNGQEIGDSAFFNAVIFGVGVDTGGGLGPHFEECGIGTVTLPPCTGFSCGFFGTLTIGVEGDYNFNFASQIFDASLVLDYNAGLNASRFFMAGWTGGTIEIQNAGAGTGSYIFDMNGIGDLIVNANCSATTTVTLRGNISRNADVAGIVYVETANVWQDTINAEVDTGLSDYDGPTNTEMEIRTPTAAQLAYIVDNANTGLPVTFTTSGGSTTVAVINQVDGAAGSSVDDQYSGRLLVFTDGTLKGVVTDITDYDGGTTTATITAIPTAPTAAHNARLI